MGEQDRGRLGRNLNARCNLILFPGLEVSRVTEHREVRSATDFVNSVDRFIGALLELCGGCQRQMASGRESCDADPIGNDLLWIPNAWRRRRPRI